MLNASDVGHIQVKVDLVVLVARFDVKFDPCVKSWRTLQTATRKLYSYATMDDCIPSHCLILPRELRCPTKCKFRDDGVLQ